MPGRTGIRTRDNEGFLGEYLMNKKIIEHGKEILDSENYESLKDYIQHGHVSVHEHSLRVAETSLRIHDFLEKMHIQMNERALVRGALLHDFFLYDWHDKKPERRIHGFTHPHTALHNAQKEFWLSEREKDIISKHMFPLTITKVPKYREAWVVSAADKWCSVIETVKRRKKPDKNNGKRRKFKRGA
jgi:uncharacterized protein